MGSVSLKELLDKEQQYLNSFFDKLDVAAMEVILQVLQKCKGMIILTGVGKSGLVAKKIAVTMTSTGSRALYISPTNALHGDLGIVTENDVCVLLSKSGESDELLNLIPFLRNKKVCLVAIVSNAASRLSRACDYSLMLPVEKELCPFDMAPTTSTIVQMILGDVLAVALMRLNKFSIEQYASNHPSGRIGKRITTTVKDLMIRGTGIPLCNPQDKLIDTLVELSNKRCGCVLVVTPEKILQGVFTDGDLRRSLLNHGPKALDLSMEQVMTHSVKSIGPNALALQAMQLMEADQRHPVTFLPVIDERQQVLGLIKIHDIVQSGL